jgi:hypothetical protein
MIPIVRGGLNPVNFGQRKSTDARIDPAREGTGLEDFIFVPPNKA